YLPPRLKLGRTWRLLYSSDQDGVSLETLYHKVRIGGGITSISDAGLVLAIRDADDHVFGAFVNESFTNNKGYYGNGDCFLWRTVQPKEGTPYIKTYPTTLRNNYNILSTHEYLSLGGGIDGRYGLWIDSSFEKGVTARSETYGNEILSDDRDRPEPVGKD
ncbi:TLD-domain-containing protein, partial [Microstroma glucosiphilum]